MVNAWVNDVVNERASCLRLSMSACRFCSVCLCYYDMFVVVEVYFSGSHS